MNKEQKQTPIIGNQREKKSLRNRQNQRGFEKKKWKSELAKKENNFLNGIKVFGRKENARRKKKSSRNLEVSGVKGLG